MVWFRQFSNLALIQVLYIHLACLLKGAVKREKASLLYLKGCFVRKTLKPLLMQTSWSVQHNGDDRGPGWTVGQVSDNAWRKNSSAFNKYVMWKQTETTMVGQWLRPRMQGWFRQWRPLFLVAAKSTNSPVFEILVHIKDPQMVKINPKPSAMARLITCVVPLR